MIAASEHQYEICNWVIHHDIHVRHSASSLNVLHILSEQNTDDPRQFQVHLILSIPIIQVMGQTPRQRY